MQISILVFHVSEVLILEKAYTDKKKKTQYQNTRLSDITINSLNITSSTLC